MKVYMLKYCNMFQRNEANISPLLRHRASTKHRAINFMVNFNVTLHSNEFYIYSNGCQHINVMITVPGVIHYATYEHLKINMCIY